MEYILCGIIASLLALLVVQEMLHRCERRDLYNRIMSRTLAEYQRAGGSGQEEPRETAHERAIKKWRNGNRS